MKGLLVEVSIILFLRVEHENLNGGGDDRHKNASNDQVASDGGIVESSEDGFWNTSYTGNCVSSHCWYLKFQGNLIKLMINCIRLENSFMASSGSAATRRSQRLNKRWDSFYCLVSKCFSLCNSPNQQQIMIFREFSFGFRFAYVAFTQK